MMFFRYVTITMALASIIAGGSTSVNAHEVTGAPSCSIFPADNPWNQRVDALPVASGSSTLVSNMNFDSLHADFSDSDKDAYGIPYTVVDGDTPTTRPEFEYDDESDPGPYPIPSNPNVEDARDSHILLVDKDNCMLYEMYAAHREGGKWYAGSGAIWNMKSNDLRPDGWTSADAAGLPILPGLARHEDIEAGSIDHALRVTVPESAQAYLWPALHYASDDTTPSATPMGLRVRLKSSFDVSGYPPQSRIILTALKQYGMIVADNGSGGFISGAPNRGWDDDDLHSLHDVPASAFEVVDTTSLPHTPKAGRIWNTRWRSTNGGRMRKGCAFVTRSGRIRAEARVGSKVRRSTTSKVRQGLACVSVKSVRGARYRLRYI